jgi:transmembrane sensor
MSKQMQERFAYLLNQYYTRQASPEELEEFYTLVDSGQYDDAIREFMDNAYDRETTAPQAEGTEDYYPPGTEFRMLRKVFQPENDQAAPAVKIRPLWPRIAAAASILLCLSVGAYFLLHKKPAVPLTNNDVAPFSKQAILKTGHGKTLVLDSNAKGTLAQYANTHIQKTGSEQIAYTNTSQKTEQVVYDTLQVPAGGKPYHLKFTDGTSIIVNVASALRFPENFEGNKREAELISGEAYFTIIHNSKSPFTLKAKGQLIEDIGTEFNVNTYSDEPESRTTLVAGAIKVNAKALVPGQQAIITEGSMVLAKANIMQAVAWKDGYFRFNGEHIQAVMRELARWYNIEVVYQGKQTDAGFFVRITRSRNISEVLKVLERTNSVHFKIEGRRVIVYGKK